MSDDRQADGVKSATPPWKRTGDIRFVEHFEPRWESGNYTLTVEQLIGSSSGATSLTASDSLEYATGNAEPSDSSTITDSFTASLTFAVLGPRFSLPPDRIHTRFPTPGGNGQFSNVLPHVVVTDKTLPWQREPGAAPSGHTAPYPSIPTDSPVYPWLAVLVFTESDPAPTVTAGSIKDLLDPPANTVTYPNLAQNLEYGEEQTVSGQTVYACCSYIDIPGDLFSKVAPSYWDLYWLAHAREVSASDGDKAFTAGSPPPTEMAVIVANRLPTPGEKASCFLVSLEGMGGSLPPAALDSTQTVRLAVLTSWSFGCADNSETFRAYFKGLDKSPAMFRRPVPDNLRSEHAKTALTLGYTALNHLTRQGATTASWYRGPLMPFKNTPVLEPPYASADALLRYDPDNGMFDTSYAAAWQLGQLLALADKRFATTLYNWKVGQQRAAVAALEQQAFAQSLVQDGGPVGKTGDGELDQAVSRAMETAIKPALANLISKVSGS